MIRKTLLIALPFVLAACGEREAAPAPSEDTTRPTTNPLVERVAGARIVVDANGLGAKGSEPLRFGSTRDEVDAVAAQAFGQPGGQSRNEECGAGPMDFSEYGPLQIAFLDGRFAGWFLREGEGVVTSDGIRAGIPLDTLKSERQVQAQDTTLEGEFSYTTADYGTITGFVDESGTITGLQAGMSCFFR